jgi:ribosomal protein S18 acetylase RimI-like enzyme
MHKRFQALPMTSPQQLEILDLRHFGAGQLRPLLEREAVVWERRLRWDYRSSTELLLQYLDSRILPGFVALHHGRICGFSFCVYEGQKAVIGDIYADPTHPESLSVVNTLSRHLLETLNASPDVHRIEAQLLLFDSGALVSAFSKPDSRTLAVYPRLFLEQELALNSSNPTIFPPQLELCRWAPAYYQPAAELIHASYIGHIDAEINDQYRSLVGSMRFLHNIVRFPGCGTFDNQSSWLLRERNPHAGNPIVAVVLCSRVASDVAHVTQLCVAPAWRGRGLGKLLLDECLRRLPGAGYRALTLTVTEANTPAVALYKSVGFSMRQRFDALVCDQIQHPQP